MGKWKNEADDKRAFHDAVFRVLGDFNKETLSFLYPKEYIKQFFPQGGDSLYLFHLPQFPPGSNGWIMVLKMITEEVAGEKSPDMILFLATRMVMIIMLAFVRSIGAKVK